MSFYKLLGEVFERALCVDGKVVKREPLLSEGNKFGARSILEVIVTEKGTCYLHSNLAENHTYYKCTRENIEDVITVLTRVLQELSE